MTERLRLRINLELSGCHGCCVAPDGSTGGEFDKVASMNQTKDLIANLLSALEEALSKGVGEFDSPLDMAIAGEFKVSYLEVLENRLGYKISQWGNRLGMKIFDPHAGGSDETF